MLMKRKYSNLSNLNPNKLRHTFTTLAREDGADINVLQNSLAHSDFITTSASVNTNVILLILQHTILFLSNQRS
ncbi:hypothetical protein [Enterococcus casseliflavus]|uniref:hypothetical protein n=2 Tax=Enterococcus TaxID=1350 RepID=UPI003D6A5E7D